jgi:hypothetical protein
MNTNSDILQLNKSPSHYTTAVFMSLWYAYKYVHGVRYVWHIEEVCVRKIMWTLLLYPRQYETANC